MPAAALVVVLIVLAVVVIARFQMRCLGQLAGTSDAELQYFSRRGWFVLIACWIPFGGMFFLCCGRRR